MEEVKQYLESSTVHGLAFIATGRKYVRLFWILVVIAGFTGAGVMIYQSFDNWAESPVKTTIEIHPITEITFPKVIVCPPRKTYTDLNYDLKMAENLTLDRAARYDLFFYANDLLYDHLKDVIINNMSKLEDNDRYYNWYHGYSQINFPRYSINTYSGHTLTFNMETTATSGTISTQYFGEKFDADKVERHLYYNINIWPPNSVKNNPNVTLHFDIERILITDLSTGQDALYDITYDDIITDISKNYTPPAPRFGSYQFLQFDRNVVMRDVRKQKLKLMPGFRLTWLYSGMEVEQEARYHDDNFTNSFVRKYVQCRYGILKCKNLKIFDAKIILNKTKICNIL